ncbi:phospholipase D [Choiromyces venosus 120613-1]|uniref:Phospholipase n=1 Tax=Choiromyces venosus 120613-1 TaxID=1336337 RepID=A0A3N4JZK4_9PEZI|nr:phospholipase D [Choiromyces venosus 120613-1]
MSAQTYLQDHPENVTESGPKSHKLQQRVRSMRIFNLIVRIVHLKNRLGKYKNLINRNHRHDELHEKLVDEKREQIKAKNRFDSFAEPRMGNGVKWYVDGRDYFWAVSMALDNAQETIYIADWWLSPELFLRRPPYYNKEWRLDKILKRRAEAGVKIYVIVYKEVAQALTCNSAYTKSALEKLCPRGSPGHENIVVMRHPDHSPFEHAADMTFYWAHHEKFIVIDHKVAFAGGLDLCFGRWDLKQHPLADVHPIGVENEIWPGQDFNNVGHGTSATSPSLLTETWLIIRQNRVMDFRDVQDWKQNPLNKKDYGRMPWHDVSLGFVGPAVLDLAEHFVGRWNFVKRDKYKRHSSYPWIELTYAPWDILGVSHPRFPVGGYVKHPLHPNNEPADDSPKGSCQVQIVRSAADWSHGILKEDSIANAYKKLISEAQHYVYIENQFFITATGEEQAPIHNTIGSAIVDAVVRAAKEKRKFRVIVVIPAIPGFPGDLRDNAATGTRAIIDYQYKSICRGKHSIMQMIEQQGIDPKQYIFFFNLRIYDRLHKSKALEETEQKSGVSYADLQRAHAVEVMGEGGVTQRRGWDGNSSESPIDSAGGSEYGRQLGKKKHRFEKLREEAQKKGLLNEHDSIAKDAMLGGDTVTSELWPKEEGPEKENFINEELYVHAKVLIIDDKVALVGSANINDRSQLGDHDSEVTVIVEDQDTMASRMNGGEYNAARFATTLRRTLWREHLGLLPPESLNANEDPNAHPPGQGGNEWDEGSEEDEFVIDPLNEDLWRMWTGNASHNTKVYRELFHCDPDDTIKTWRDYDQFIPRSEDVKSGHLVVGDDVTAEQVREKLGSIRGHLVWMPLCFLQGEELAEKGLQVNTWTESIYT